jgi:enoyl-CoA hydratase
MTATATNFENIELVIEDSVAIITIARPKVMNALNNALLRELVQALDEIKASDEARVLVITGSGDKAFVAGADINELAKMKPLEAKDLAAYGQSVYRKIEDLGIPSIAMINGFALGGGMELALACSLRTASTKARLGLPEVSLGIIPGYGGTQRLSRVAGPGVAREWVLLGDIFTADEAHRVGIVNRVFAPEELLEGTMKMVETMLSRAPIALRLALEAIGRGGNMSQQEGEIIECDMFGLAATTEDMQEGMGAFIEKRRANFQGK